MTDKSAALDKKRKILARRQKIVRLATLLGTGKKFVPSRDDLVDFYGADSIAKFHQDCEQICKDVNGALELLAPMGFPISPPECNEHDAFVVRCSPFATAFAKDVNSDKARLAEFVATLKLDSHSFLIDENRTLFFGCGLTMLKTVQATLRHRNTVHKVCTQSFDIASSIYHSGKYNQGTSQIVVGLRTSIDLSSGYLVDHDSTFSPPRINVAVVGFRSLDANDPFKIHSDRPNEQLEMARRAFDEADTIVLVGELSKINAGGVASHVEIPAAKATRVVLIVNEPDSMYPEQQTQLDKIIANTGYRLETMPKSWQSIHSHQLRRN